MGDMAELYMDDDDDDDDEREVVSGDRDFDQRKMKDVPDSCPYCGEPMAVRDGRYGRFAACTGYPKCEGFTCKVSENIPLGPVITIKESLKPRHRIGAWCFSRGLTDMLRWYGQTGSSPSLRMNLWTCRRRCQCTGSTNRRSCHTGSSATSRTRMGMMH